MNPTSSAVRLDGNQNFLAVFSMYFSFIWCQSWKRLSLFDCQEAKLLTDLLFQGQIQAVSRGTSPTRTTATLTSWDFGSVNGKPCLSVLSRFFSFLKM